MGPIEKLGPAQDGLPRSPDADRDRQHGARWSRSRAGIALDPDALPLDDAKTYSAPDRGADVRRVPAGVGGHAGRAARGSAPSGSRTSSPWSRSTGPGPMEMIPDFINRKHGRVPRSTYEHPVMEKHLQETYGIMVYQEQVMQIASELAGFTHGRGRHPPQGHGQEGPRAHGRSSARSSSRAARAQQDRRAQGRARSWT